jgi:ATP-binding cassette subfamily B (MDR/TAP) protein 1
MTIVAIAHRLSTYVTLYSQPYTYMVLLFRWTHPSYFPTLHVLFHSIVDYDQIAVISDGCIAELGSHQALLESGGIYATLCKSQGITTETTFHQSGSHPTQGMKDSDDGPAAPIEAPDIEHGIVPLTTSITKEAAGMKEEIIKQQKQNQFAWKTRLWMLNKPEWGYILMGTVGSCIVGALQPCEGILTARIVQNFYTVDWYDLVEVNRDEIILFLLFGFASFVGNLFSGCGFSVSGYRLTRRMRCLAFESIIRRPMGWFDDPDHSVGNLTTSLERDAAEVSKVTGWALGYRIRVFSSLVTGISIALGFSWKMGLTAIACAPVILAAGLVQKLCGNSPETSTDGLSPETIFEQGLRGIDAVQTYNLQHAWSETYDESVAKRAQSNVKTGAVAGAVYGLSQFAIFGSFAIVFFVGTKLLVSKEINFIEFFTPVLSVIFGALGVAQVNADFNAQQEGLAAAGRTFEIIDEQLDEADPFRTDGSHPNSLNGSIHFKDITFYYPTRPSKPIYYPSGGNNGFSLSINAKESVAFVGKSGCGYVYS